MIKPARLVPDVITQSGGKSGDWPTRIGATHSRRQPVSRRRRCGRFLAPSGNNAVAVGTRRRRLSLLGMHGGGRGSSDGMAGGNVWSGGAGLGGRQ